MKTATAIKLLTPAAMLVLGACANSPLRHAGAPLPAIEIVSHHHAGDDDLLTAGLGAAGLRSPVPPAFVDPTRPTAAELRRRAIWSNWRGIADLAPGGGYGELYGSLTPVPGSEFHGLATLPGAHQPHHLMVQVPDDFDAQARCVVVTASSGSRGIYGAIALAGSWGLSHRCAVAYTDKGAGTTYVDTSTGLGNELDGTRAATAGRGEFVLAADPTVPAAIASKHANSGDHPEADWGRHVRQAAEFALQVLNSSRASEPAYTFDNTIVIAAGVSNGGGAVLRAAELPGRWLDGVVAVSPNILPAKDGRALFDYASEAAQLMPCALDAATFDGAPFARPGGRKSPAGALRCASLRAAGVLAGDSDSARADAAHALLRSHGWSDGAIAAGALSTTFDLWRSVLVTYASGYSRAPANAMPCGYRFAAIDATGAVHAPTAVEQAAWWSDASGIPPGAGVGIVDTLAKSADASWPGLQCLRGLWSEGEGAALRAGVEATRATLPRKGLPVIVAHGVDDGLVPEAFSGGAYARWSKAAGRDVRYWRVANAQHFDAFLGVPAMAASYVPMLPYAYRALDAMWATLHDGAPLPADAELATRRRAVTAAGVAPLTAAELQPAP